MRRTGIRGGCLGSRRLRRPVTFRAERSEAFLSDFQGRDLHIEAELALDAAGNFLALRSVNTANNGAYTTSFVPLNKGAQLMSSLYRVPVAHVVARAAVTNTPATIPYRSAGRPEASTRSSGSLIARRGNAGSTVWSCAAAT